MAGVVGTVAVFSLVFANAVLTGQGVAPPKSRPRLTVLMLPADAPSPPKDLAPPPPRRQVARPARPATPPIAPAAVAPPIVQIAAPSQAVAVPTVTPAPAQPVPRLASSPTPPENAPAQRHGPDKWESRILARLERFRRYPVEAQRARMQGTATIRFRLDRAGRVLSMSLEESSGSPMLDAAALDTVRRADPLPRIPADRPDEVELSVPVEFTIGR